MITPLSLNGLFVWTPRKISDDRGYFVETFREDRLELAAGPNSWLQDNLSYSKNRFTVRGLHVQLPPSDQAKLVRCTRGAILDVAVDVRPESASFGQSVGLVLSRENGKQLYIPKGFAHGFATLEPATEVAYKVTAYYDANQEIAIQFDDPFMNIDWPFTRADATLSSRDASAPSLNDQLHRLAGCWATERK